MIAPTLDPSQPLTSQPPAQPPQVSPPSPGTPPRPPQPVPPVVAPGWPLKRPLNPVIVLPRYDDRRRHDRDRDRRWRDRDRDHDRHRHDRPLRFLPLVIFGGMLVDNWDDRRWRDRLSWEDAVTLYDEEGWVEFTLDCGARGEKLWIEVRDGRGRIDWAEVVFEDGESQVVDFADRSLGPGLYRLLEMRGTRRVDYVRMSARASTREVRLILRLER